MAVASFLYGLWEKAGWRNLFQLLAIGVFVVAVGLLIVHAVAGGGEETAPKQVSAPAPEHESPGKVLRVYNKIPAGANGMEESEEPVNLLTRPAASCPGGGCLIPETTRETGETYESAVCQVEGDWVTNESDESRKDDTNPGNFKSRRFYEVRLDDGVYGFVSEVWVDPKDRGGLGLRECSEEGSGTAPMIVKQPSSNPRARIVELTGSYSEDGFGDAIVERDIPIVALYLKAGESATTLYKGASAILWGFQGMPQNGDPVALIETFQNAGFEVEEDFEDSYLMTKLTEEFLPLIYETDLTPKGYTGGYAGGKFVGSLLFWIVQDATWFGLTAEHTKEIDYLIGQGASCEIPLDFLEYTKPDLAGTKPYPELVSMMRACAGRS